MKGAASHVDTGAADGVNAMPNSAKQGPGARREKTLHGNSAPPMHPNDTLQKVVVVLAQTRGPRPNGPRQ